MSEHNEEEAETLTSKTYFRLRSDIIQGVLPPGQKLKTAELTRAYGVGASPMREALSMLTSGQLVERIEQRGFRVAPVSRAEFLDLLQVRCLLESHAIKEAVRNGDSAWEDRIITLQYRLSRVPRSLDEDKLVENPEWEKLHKAFHLALVSGFNSPITLRICEETYDQSVRYRRLAGTITPPRLSKRNFKEEHAAIAAAALDRNADEAARLLVEHYQATASMLEGRLPSG